jgi:hypothetical protein
VKNEPQTKNTEPHEKSPKSGRNKKKDTPSLLLVWAFTLSALMPLTERCWK